MRLVCLHGFLGLSSDFKFLGDALADRGFNLEVKAIDLWPFAPRTFDEVALEIAGVCGDDDILLGYSMGGRIASHAFFMRDACAAGGLVVVSAHFGGLSSSEIEERRIRDEAWAKKFEDQEWSSLMSDWNAQPVFEKGKKSGLTRTESRFDRRALAHGLRAWSVVNQPDPTGAMKSSKRPALWLAGEHDTKYAGVAKQLAAVSDSLKTKVIPNAGHRLPWGSKQAFVDEVATFIEGAFPSKAIER